MDPQTIEAPIVLSFAGHDGPSGASSIKRLAAANLVKMEGMGPLHMAESEDAVVNRTGEVFPSMIIGGMEISEAFSLPRMGASFGGMLASGERAAYEAIKLYDSLEIDDGVVLGKKA